MKKLFGAMFLWFFFCPYAHAELSEDIIAKAERDIAGQFASFGLENMRRQLVAPGKSDEEKDKIITTAVRELAKCYVSTSIKFAAEHGLSAISLLRLQAGWELTEADRDTMTRLDNNKFRASQQPCKEAFSDALPMRVG